MDTGGLTQGAPSRRGQTGFIKPVLSNQILSGRLVTAVSVHPPIPQPIQGPILTDQLQIPKDQCALTKTCLLFRHTGEISLLSFVLSIFIASTGQAPFGRFTGHPQGPNQASADLTDHFGRTARRHLKPLSRDTMNRYLFHHFCIEGVNTNVFEDAAITAIHQESGGLFRKANNLARDAPIAAANDQSMSVSGEQARLAAAEIF